MDLVSFIEDGPESGRYLLKIVSDHLSSLIPGVKEYGSNNTEILPLDTNK